MYRNPPIRPLGESCADEQMKNRRRADTLSAFLSGVTSRLSSSNKSDELFSPSKDGFMYVPKYNEILPLAHSTFNNEKIVDLTETDLVASQLPNSKFKSRLDEIFKPFSTGKSNFVYDLPHEHEEIIVDPIKTDKDLASHQLSIDYDDSTNKICRLPRAKFKSTISSNPFERKNDLTYKKKKLDSPDQPKAPYKSIFSFDPFIKITEPLPFVGDSSGYKGAPGSQFQNEIRNEEKLLPGYSQFNSKPNEAANYNPKALFKPDKGSFCNIFSNKLRDFSSSNRVLDNPPLMSGAAQPSGPFSISLQSQNPVNPIEPAYNEINRQQPFFMPQPRIVERSSLVAEDLKPKSHFCAKNNTSFQIDLGRDFARRVTKLKEKRKKANPSAKDWKDCVVYPKSIIII